MEAIDRVFFHELGHVVAQEINRRYYGGTAVAGVSFYPCADNKEIYCGHMTPVVPAGVDIWTEAPLERMPRYLASMMYGCFFQDYYHKREEFNECLELHGHKDWEGWKDSLAFHKKFDLRNECMDAEHAYYKQLRETGGLEDFMKLVPTDYLVHREGMVYEINLPKLFDALHDAIDKHYPLYATLIDHYGDILKIPKA